MPCMSPSSPHALARLFCILILFKPRRWPHQGKFMANGRPRRDLMKSRDPIGHRLVTFSTSTSKLDIGLSSGKPPHPISVHKLSEWLASAGPYARNALHLHHQVDGMRARSHLDCACESAPSRKSIRTGLGEPRAKT